MRVGRGRCSERLAGSEAYLPVLEALESLQRHEQLGSLTRLIRALAPSWYAQLMPPTENDSSAARLAAETAGGSQERLKREIASLLEEAGRLQPIVLWFDDVHWADPSTTDLLGTWRGGSTTHGCSSSRPRGRRSCASRAIRSWR